MKLSINARSASLALALGLFFSCGTANVNIDALIAESSYSEALSAVNKQLEKDPNQEILYFQKSKVLGLMAKEQPVDQRVNTYQEIVETMNSASSLYDPPLINPKLDSLRIQLWKQEHNSGLLEYDAGPDNYSTSIAHFNNAVTIKEDAVSSYKALAVVQYNNDDLDGALATLNSAKKYDEADTEIYEYLGFLNLEKGNAEQATFYYRLAGKDILENKNIGFGLVNAYISADQRTDAIELLEDLIEAYPRDAQLQNVYGTQLFNHASSLFKDYKTVYLTNDSAQVNNYGIEIERISESAEEALQLAYSADTTSVDYIESLAVFYNNMAGNYLSVMEVAFEKDKTVLRQKAIGLLDFASTYYGKLAELMPNNSSYTTKLERLKKLKAIWTD